ncbi:MAG: hypothetical protein EXR79_01610 [Myxococcales bacterium]|nr:hypothetical protein [Myxococcales bacterium]
MMRRLPFATVAMLLAQAAPLAAQAAPVAAQAAAPRMPAGPFDAQLEPGSRAALRASWFTAETQHRKRPPALPAQPTGPFAWQAADFAHLPKGAWEITHQDITAELFPGQSLLKLQIVATFKAYAAKVDSLALSMRGSESMLAELPDGTTATVTVDVQEGGAALVTVKLPKALEPGQSVTLAFERVAKLDCKPGGLGFLPCSVTKPYFYVESRWYVLDAPFLGHMPSTLDLHVVTADTTLVAAAPGKPTGPDVLPDGRRVFHFKQPERTENGGFALAPYAVVQAADAVPYPALRIYTMGGAVAAQATLTMVKDVAAFYAPMFGPFAWQGLNIIQLMPNFGGGYSPLSGIFVYRWAVEMTEDQYGWEQTVELMAHEVGHQWWGNLVEPYTTGDVALSESMAEYSSCLYMEKQYKTRGQIVSNNLEYVYTVKAADDKAVASPTVYASPRYTQIVYYKGSVVVDMLRRELGDDMMAKVLAAFTKDFSRDFARISDLRKTAEQVAGRDLGWFFQQWFEKGGALRAEVTGRVVPPANVAAQDAQWTVRIRVVQPEAPRRIKLPVTVWTAEHKAETFQVDVEPVAGQPATVVEVKVGAPVQRVRLDPERVLLRAFAGGTPGDVNLDGLTDGADLVDLAFRYGRAVARTAKNGQTYFFADPGWSEVHDVEADLRINAKDRTTLLQWLGTQSEEF